MLLSNKQSTTSAHRKPWNKGKLIGQKPPLQPKHVWAIRTRLQLEKNGVKEWGQVCVVALLPPVTR
jgi:hypothetical protein